MATFEYVKIGDGTTPWSSLPYVAGFPGSTGTTGSTGSTGPTGVTGPAGQGLTPSTYMSCLLYTSDAADE